MTPEEAVDVLVRHARPLIRRTHGRDSCLFSTAVALGFLDAVGVPARRLEVETFAFNRRALDEVDAGNVDAAAWPDEAWSVGVTQGVRPRLDGRPAWPGAHLVAHVLDLDVLVDVSADQLDRPAKALHVLGPLVAEPVITDGYAAVLPAGGAVVYKPVDRPARIDSRDFHDPIRRRAVVAALIHLARQPEGATQ